MDIFSLGAKAKPLGTEEVVLVEDDVQMTREKENPNNTSLVVNTLYRDGLSVLSEADKN